MTRLLYIFLTPLLYWKRVTFRWSTLQRTYAQGNHHDHLDWVSVLNNCVRVVYILLKCRMWVTSLWHPGIADCRVVLFLLSARSHRRTLGQSRVLVTCDNMHLIGLWTYWRSITGFSKANISVYQENRPTERHSTVTGKTIHVLCVIVRLHGRSGKRIVIQQI